MERMKSVFVIPGLIDDYDPWLCSLDAKTQQDENFRGRLLYLFYGTVSTQPLRYLRSCGDGWPLCCGGLSSK